MAGRTRGTSRTPLPQTTVSTKARTAIARRLGAVTGEMTRAAVGEMEQRHSWFSDLDARHRASVSLVAQAGIDGFVQWFTEAEPTAQVRTGVFGSAPRELTRQISLLQTVELVRTTIDVVEDQIDELLPKNDRPVLHAAIVQYSREVAFAAAEIYARAAELRGAWDARLESMVVDAVVRGDPDENVLSRAATLGWPSAAAAVVVVGAAPAPDHVLDGGPSLDVMRARASRAGIDVLASVQGDRLVVVLGGPALDDVEVALRVVRSFVAEFGPGPVVVGPRVEHLADAAGSTRAALAGYRAAPAWPEAPRPVTAHDLLPERALAGDGHARRMLANELYDPLAQSGGGLLETLVTFLDSGSSVEATGRALYVHANTVRYRLRRIHEVTGYSPNDPRDAYALRLALTLGRLRHRGTLTANDTAPA